MRAGVEGGVGGKSDGLRGGEEESEEGMGAREFEAVEEKEEEAEEGSVAEVLRSFPVGHVTLKISMGTWHPRKIRCTDVFKSTDFWTSRTKELPKKGKLIDIASLGSPCHCPPHN